MESEWETPESRSRSDSSLESREQESPGVREYRESEWESPRVQEVGIPWSPGVGVGVPWSPGVEVGSPGSRSGSPLESGELESPGVRESE